MSSTKTDDQAQAAAEEAALEELLQTGETEKDDGKKARTKKTGGKGGARASAELPATSDSGDPASNGNAGADTAAGADDPLDTALERITKLEKLIGDIRNSPDRQDPEMARIIEENLVMSEARVTALKDRREGEKQAQRLEAQRRADEMFGLTRDKDGTVTTITTVVAGQPRELTATVGTPEVLDSSDAEKEKEGRLKAEAALEELRKQQQREGGLFKKIRRGLGYGSGKPEESDDDE